MCRKCGETKQREQFHYALKPKREYISSYCKACHYVQSRQWINKNPEKSKSMARESKRRMRLDPVSKERERQQKNAWYARLPEKRKNELNGAKCVASAEKYLSDPEFRARANANNRMWIANNRERYALLQSYNSAKRRAILAGGPLGEKVSPGIIQCKLFKQSEKCFYCGTDIVSGFHIDHFIPLSKGGAHSQENLVLACKKCNQTKHAIMPGKFCAQPKPWAFV